jgi:tRNA-specific adenosine deaminase 2
MMDIDEEESYYMRQALRVAKSALRRGEVPVGCILVYHPSSESASSPVVLSYGANRVNATRDATRHAELVAIDRVLCQGISSDQLCLPDSLLPSSRDDNDEDDEFPWNPPQNILNRSSFQQEWNKCDLYVTCEPCIMCAAALREIGISRVFFGCYNDRFGGCGSILNLHRRHPTMNSKKEEEEQGNDPYYYQVKSGILQQEAISLLQQFYKQENCHAPADRRKKKKKINDNESNSK